MKSQNNDTIAKNAKRRAKRIKREQGLPHHLALEKAAQENGFQNWKNFTNQLGRPAIKLNSTEQKKTLPKPLTVPFHWINNSRDSRPNTKVSIESHQQLGRKLKELYFATEYDKTARTNIGKVRNTLDEWIQREYPSRQELTDEVFFSIYYGNFETKVTPWPDQVRKKELKDLANSTINLLEICYHHCTPLKKLVYQMGQAIKAINNWPMNKNVKFERKDRQIKNGTIVGDFAETDHPVSV